MSTSQQKAMRRSMEQGMKNLQQQQKVENNGYGSEGYISEEIMHGYGSEENMHGYGSEELGDGQPTDEGLPSPIVGGATKAARKLGYSGEMSMQTESHFVKAQQMGEVSLQGQSQFQQHQPGVGEVSLMGSSHFQQQQQQHQVGEVSLQGTSRFQRHQPQVGEVSLQGASQFEEVQGPNGETWLKDLGSRIVSLPASRERDLNGTQRSQECTSEEWEMMAAPLSKGQKSLSFFSPLAAEETSIENGSLLLYPGGHPKHESSHEEAWAAAIRLPTTP